MMLPYYLASLIFLYLNPITVQGKGLYSKQSPVLQVTGKTYDKLIAQSPILSVIEFYAPWCGHCQKLKPAFEKAATNLEGFANVAAVNCDDGPNKRLCGTMGVQGFPTLKIVKPSKKGGQPLVEDYKGARSAKAITNTVVDKIPNYVKRLDDKELSGWLEDSNGTAKAILFSDKWSTSTLYKVLAMEYRGTMLFAQMKDKAIDAISMFGVSTFPTLVLLPGGDGAAQTYGGDLKKDKLKEFLSQAGAPGVRSDAMDSNPNGKTGSQVASQESSFSQASAAHMSSEASAAAAGATSVTVDSEPNIVESPDPDIDSDKPVKIQENEPSSTILTLDDDLALREACLEPQKRLCALLLLPEENSGDALSSATAALHGLAAVKSKYSQGQSKLFPIYAVPFSNPMASRLRQAFDVRNSAIPQLIAVHFKKNWWKDYSVAEFTDRSIETWVDAIRMGEGPKKTFPENVLQLEEARVGENSGSSAETSAEELQQTEQKNPIEHNEL